MRLRVLFHDNCFDGAASAALFTRFFRERVAPDAEISYRGMHHKPGEVFPEGSFDGDENVVVATHVGTPPESASTWPFVPADVVAIAPVPLPRRIAFSASALCPVPPLPTGKMPVTFDARSTSAADKVPAVAFKNPDRLPTEREPKNPRVEDA